ncbi:hypothetical protein C8R48DRAFT_773695 [Suillus tomentosus]|nr:hypothetical protein C8R48DRAFT_773695 [Suillus tomentosus]
MEDSQSQAWWQAQFDYQQWLNRSTSTRGILHPQPQPEFDLTTVPDSDSGAQTDEGFHHVEYSLPQWQAPSTHGSFDSSEAPMSQPMLAQFGNSNSGLIPPSLPQSQVQVSAQIAGSLNSGLIPSSSPQWQQVPAQIRGSTPRPIPPSLLQLQEHVPQPVLAQMGGSLNPGLIPLPQWQQVPAQFGGPNSGLIPPSLPQLPAHVPQPVSVQIGGSNSGLLPSQPQWQPALAQVGGSNSGLISPSLPQLPVHAPQPMSLQLRGSKSGLFPSQPQWQSTLAQFGDLNSGLIPPSLPQWQASVPQSVPAQHGGSNSRLSPSQLHWQAPSSSDSRPFCPPLSDTNNSESPIDPFQANITENLCRVRSIRTSHKRDSEKFTAFGDAKRARTTRTREERKLDPVMPDVLERFKESTRKEMVQRTFENGLFPTVDEIATMAIAALDAAIGPDDARLKQWSTTQEGRHLVSKLKGTVKNIHSDFQKVAPIIVLASHQSLVELLMTNADMQATQAARIDNLVDDISSFDVAIQWPSEDGHVRSVQAPLGHSSVTALLDYVLLTKKYSKYLCMDTGNWQARFTHAFAFSAATCRGKLRKHAQSGWDNAVADNF